MCEIRFYVCEHCGNIIGVIHNAGVPMMCCGQKMTKHEAGVVEARNEKHIPVVERDGNIIKVTIGSDTYTLNQTVTFESNKQYKCTLKVNRISEGVNIGIGGWEASDTDFGGTLE